MHVGKRSCQRLTAISYSLKTNAKHNISPCGDLKDDNKQTLKLAQSDVELFMDLVLNSKKIIRKDIGKKLPVTTTNR